MNQSENILNSKEINIESISNNKQYKLQNIVSEQNGESISLKPTQHTPYILNGELYRILTQIGDNVLVKCCYCPPERVYRGSIRSTGNFHMHIKRCHPHLLDKLHKMKVNSLLERKDRFVRYRKRNKVSAVQSSKSKIKNNLMEPQQQQQQNADYNNNNTDLKLNLNNFNTDLLKYNGNYQKNILEKSLLNVSNGGTDVFNSNNQTFHRTSLEKTSGSTIINKDSSQQYNYNQVLDLSLHRESKQHSSPKIISTDQGLNLNDEVHKDYNTSILHQVLSQLQHSLRSIEHELNVRNQIERNHFLFEMAKFKYIYPNFHYNG